MDNIQLYYIDNEINKIDKMKQGDVIYKNGVELLVVLSYDHNEPCKGCFFYEDKACGSERLIKCWDCKKEYIFTAIRKYNTTELCGIVKRYEETILKTIKKIEKECCTGCCFYDNGNCKLENPNCFNSGIIWVQKEDYMSEISEKAIKLAIEAMRPIPVYSSPCYSVIDNRSPEEKHEEDMRFCKEFNDLKCEMLIDMAKKIEVYLSHN